MKQAEAVKAKKGQLVLQDGTKFDGEIFGAAKSSSGEVGKCFYDSQFPLPILI